MTQPLSPADPARLGAYEILARLGTGGQGVVYLGRARDGEVAIKLLHARTIADAGARARFVRELSLLQRVAGFCTAQMLEADMAGDRPYIVSEYIPGPSLRRLVQDRGPRTGADLDRLAIRSVTALTAIHRAGIVHRDFKPQNVLMGPDGPRVIDFGIARALDSEATLTSQLIGTPSYMAPEQFAGADIGPAADMFAWALTLLFAATGRDAFTGPSVPVVMYRIMNETPDVSVLPDEIADVALACLRKNPAARPTAEEVLLRLLGENNPPPPSLSETAGGARRADPPPARERWSPPPREAPPTGADPHMNAPPAYPEPADPARPLPRDEAPPPARPGAPAHRTGAAGPPPAPPAAGPGGHMPYQGPPAETHPGRGGPQPDGRQDGPGTRDGGAYPRRLPRNVPVVAGLVLAGLLAALDVASLAILVAQPELSEGPGGRWLPVVAGSFVLLAVVTLVGVVLAWRGSRAAAWTVLAVRVLRVAMWGAWSALVAVQVSALALHAGVTALVVVLLAAGLRSR
ncbi:protein kinase [Spirillospora sp. NPDC029432]|uniref:serine/threonine-protein kinase n=1 Tax=Spirillospora sp. NPDC029432 TaxID=3154599 RepID=UPI003451B866